MRYFIHCSILFSRKTTFVTLFSCEGFSCSKPFAIPVSTLAKGGSPQIILRRYKIMAHRRAMLKSACLAIDRKGEQEASHPYLATAGGYTHTLCFPLELCTTQCLAVFRASQTENSLWSQLWMQASNNFFFSTVIGHPTGFSDVFHISLDKNDFACIQNNQVLLIPLPITALHSLGATSKS